MNIKNKLTLLAAVLLALCADLLAGCGLLGAATPDNGGGGTETAPAISPVAVIPPVYNGGSLTYGDALPVITTATQGGVIALDADQTLLAGTRLYKWTFTPAADTVKYSKTTGTIPLTVRKADVAVSPVCTDTALTYGDSASSVRLIALPSVSAVTGAAVTGRLALDAGQVLLAGGRYYRWTFIPTDGGNYDYAAGEIFLDVSKAPQTIPPGVTLSVSWNGGYTSAALSVSGYSAGGGSGAYEFSLDNSVWRDSNVFTGLSAGAEYTFYARLKETDNYLASPSKSVNGFAGDADGSAGDTDGGTYDAADAFTYAGNTVTGLTELGKTLSLVVIPSQIGDRAVTKIGDRAFYDCDNLTGITVPRGITEIGFNAFYDCDGLTAADIPEGVTEIGANVFYGCDNLTEIRIPASLPFIDEVFASCPKLTAITVAAGNGAYESRGGVLYSYERRDVVSGDWRNGNVETVYDKSRLTLTAYPAGKTESAFTAPGSVTEIGYGAFENCAYLIEVIIPQSVTAIGNRAFFNCVNLSGIIIPDGVTAIGFNAFYGCGLTEITIPRNVILVGYGAFYGCGSLINIVIQGKANLAEADAAWNNAWRDGVSVGIIRFEP